ncbi:snake venom serine protease rhinocerase 5-like [Lycorma delicatula]|uniref:snake venom serine protease rhinocerase 5-like n=1 Tax=Lycorma delicatula TaxID=130591 RepID=UPI003F51748A
MDIYKRLSEKDENTISGEVRDETNEIASQIRYKSKFLTGIIGGKEVSITKHPYVLAVLINDRLKGAAVLLNKNWALTTAFNVLNNNAFSGGKTTTSKKIVRHPEYVGLWNDDLALIKLATPAIFSESVKSISIAESLPNEGTNAVVIGWGGKDYSFSTNGTLREAVVPVNHYETCKYKYQDIPEFTRTSFCTAIDDVGPCTHDLGDPLVFNKTVIGIFSGTFDCGSTKRPAVYADVTKYNEWINSVIKLKTNKL